MSIELTTLPGGIRVITDTVPSVESVALGIWADVGTRHEDLAHNGVAHMVEHMMFKGTPARSAVRIAEEIENVGGHMNAYTSREVTAYHIHLLREDMPLALDVLADIIQNPLLPEEEIVRERSVIVQEIGMTLDTPDDWVFDLHQEISFPGQALGAPILGKAEIVQAMGRDTLADYVRRFYTPGRLVVSAAGNLAHRDFVSRVESLLQNLPQDTPAAITPAAYKGGEARIGKELEQSHIVLGFEGLARTDRDYYAATTLATVLGGGMSSRLFQEVREKRGLVYSVFSFHHSYQDAGQFAIYAGCGESNLPELIPVLCEEIGKARQPVSAEELARAKSQLKASLLMGRESMMNRAGAQARHLVHFGEILDIREKITLIDALTVEDLARAAARIFASEPSLAALGPLGPLEEFGRIKERLAA
jgi:predicted Zn-dependent peptidase